jgi:hypothetical protein
LLFSSIRLNNQRSLSNPRTNLEPFVSIPFLDRCLPDPPGAAGIVVYGDGRPINLVASLFMAWWSP